MSRTRAPGGFTLLEIMVSLAILGTLVAMTLTNMTATVRGRDIVLEDLRRPKISNAVISQVVKDLRYLWFGGLTGNAGFLGRSAQVGGRDADRIDFITARTGRTVPLDEDNRAEDAPQAQLCEVGYALRQSETGRHLELWRREDPYVDDDPVNGGSYTLVYDRIRELSWTFFDRPGETQDTKGQEEWDSRVRKRVPYALILQLTFDVEEVEDPRREPEPEKVVRIFLLKPGNTMAVDWPATATNPNEGSNPAMR